MTQSYSEILQLLKLPSEEFIKHCTSSNYQSQGAGGQKRNKVKSGIRLALKNSDLETTSCEQRSPKANSSDGVRKLKLLIALSVRHDIIDGMAFEFPGSETRINPKNTLYYVFIKQALDLFTWNKGELKATAEVFKLSSSALVRIFYTEKKVLEVVQNVRRLHELPPLKK